MLGPSLRMQKKIEYPHPPGFKVCRYRYGNQAMYNFVQHYDLSSYAPLFQRPQVQILLEFRNTLVRRVGAENPTSGLSLNHPYHINVFLMYGLQTDDAYST